MRKGYSSYKNRELLQIIKTTTSLGERRAAQNELDSRNLDAADLRKLENSYRQVLVNSENRKNKSLSFDEQFLFFVIPFFTSRPRWRHDHFSESELERFREHGFDLKRKQAQMIRFFGVVFWILILMAVFYFLS
ncbi:hypothetical protein ACFSYG_05345 [Leeuwenhoekiella polynyae]|uniref:Uncharacterized protein n=1 Tax=Leeuwenhoekiella polynyae TaxID=1550906 RepID=A0A4Q0P1Y2_9FLAO|nr:hypothetical protein [Leeuwenhoekiella polynyae]RXG20530.1 hypothetical protein DSM02_2383 [Leeuwenhoekiella polynyae]|tara:strand:+ start:612 stop:1013 length:402 start_codon:yes stop_codon:yes gene_type:complete